MAKDAIAFFKFIKKQPTIVIKTLVDFAFKDLTKACKQ